jgi:hypothetical protein
VAFLVNDDGSENVLFIPEGDERFVVVVMVGVDCGGAGFSFA